VSDEQQQKRGRGRPKKSALADTAEELALFYKWRDELLPKLASLQAASVGPEDILKSFSNEAAARLVTLALTSKDQKIALAAMQDVLDRSQGKATQRTVVTNKFDNLKDEEIDALYAETIRTDSKQSVRKQ
jgi:hypothetical protein